MENTLTVVVDDKKTQRLLREILHQLEDIYQTLDSIDDISDITDSMKQTTEKIKLIGKSQEEI